MYTITKYIQWYQSNAKLKNRLTMQTKRNNSWEQAPNTHH